MHNHFVFIAGLHRTGTSLLARLLGAHPQISSITGAPVPENEGCYLQGAIPHTALHGRPGHYATDPLQHHVEGSRYDTLEVKQRLLADWSAWYDPAKPWWLEKSPVNLSRMRLYQQLLPTSQFIVILRHPQVMAAALRKWVDEPVEVLLQYGLAAYRQMAADLPYLHCALVLRYEDLVSRPSAALGAACAYLGLDPIAPALDVRNGNTDYEIDSNAPDGRAVEAMSQWGYEPGGTAVSWEAGLAHPLRDRREHTRAILAGEASF